MTPKEYNAMPEGDTKLAVRLAITMGWYSDGIELNMGVVWVRETWFEESGMCIPFNPFTDHSIPFGLIGHGVDSVVHVNVVHANTFVSRANKSIACSEAKTHAIIQAFCAADPLGHWARFMKGGE